MFNKSLIFLVFIAISFFSCSVKKPKEKIVVPVKKEVPVVVKNKFERLPATYVQAIFNNCNNLDITFYEGDKSVSLWDDNVKYILSMITGDSPKTLNNSVIGHIMMLKDGDNISFNKEELSLVEISMTGNNNYVIYKIGEKKYYNNINQKGIDFFNKMMGRTK